MILEILPARYSGFRPVVSSCSMLEREAAYLGYAAWTSLAAIARLLEVKEVAKSPGWIAITFIPKSLVSRRRASR